ncbi:MAG: hypothetical protein ACTHOB_16300 [Ginsengibacter sp.]
MKYKPFLILTSLFFITLTASNCKKDKRTNPVDQLPAITETGANTFGCLVNGKVFLPKGNSLTPKLKCAYQFLNTDYSKGYFFQLSAGDLSNSNDITGVGIYTDSLAITTGNYNLDDNKKGSAYGLYIIINSQENENLYTQSSLPGQLTITKFDEANQIVAGTFWFTTINTNGDTIKVTDGRFDMRFTK